MKTFHLLHHIAFKLLEESGTIADGKMDHIILLMCNVKLGSFSFILMAIRPHLS